VGLLAREGKVTRDAALLEALLEREGLGSTGIGHGVAIPHARTNDVTRLMVAFGRSEAELDFDAIDGQPTRLFFLLVAPEEDNATHLHLLAKLARLMKNANTRTALLGLEGPEAVVELFARLEEA